MLQDPCKTLGFNKKYGLRNSPGEGGVNHIQPVACRVSFFERFFFEMLSGCQMVKIQIRADALLVPISVQTIKVISSRHKSLLAKRL